MADQELEWNPAQGFRAKDAGAAETLEIFVSHSHHDKELAKRLIALVRLAFGLKAKATRCSSVEGHQFGIGTDVGDELRREIKEARVFIALWTPHSLKSHWVSFEAGARWQTGQKSFSLVSAVTPEQLPAIPLSSKQVLSCANEAQLFQFITDLGENLGKEPEDPASLHDWVVKVVEISKSMTTNFLTAVTLDGEIGVGSEWGSSWINLDHPQDFYRGDRIRLFLGKATGLKPGSARKVLVRLLRNGENPGKAVGVLTPEGVLVPPSGIVEVEVPADFNEIVHVSVHGGEKPWHYFLGKGNGPATLTKVELLSCVS